MPQADQIRIWWWTDYRRDDIYLALRERGWSVQVASSPNQLEHQIAATLEELENNPHPDVIFIGAIHGIDTQDYARQLKGKKYIFISFSPDEERNHTRIKEGIKSGLNFNLTLGYDPQRAILDPRRLTLLEQAIRLNRPTGESQGGRIEAPRNLS